MENGIIENGVCCLHFEKPFFNTTDLLAWLIKETRFKRGAWKAKDHRNKHPLILTVVLTFNFSFVYLNLASEEDYDRFLGGALSALSC